MFKRTHETITKDLRRMVQDLHAHRDDMTNEALIRREVAEDHHAAADAAEQEAVKAHEIAGKIAELIS